MRNRKAPPGGLGQKRKGAREGPPVRSLPRGEASDAQGGAAERGREAEEQQEDRSEAIEIAFELRERHDTHLSVGCPGEAELFLLNNVQIGAI